MELLYREPTQNHFTGGISFSWHFHLGWWPSQRSVQWAETNIVELSRFRVVEKGQNYGHWNLGSAWRDIFIAKTVKWVRGHNGSTQFFLFTKWNFIREEKEKERLLPFLIFSITLTVKNKKRLEGATFFFLVDGLGSDHTGMRILFFAVNTQNII